MPPSLSLPARRLARGAVALAIAAAAQQALASTAANTTITNQATVNYSDLGGAALLPVTASATVTVTLVPSAPALTSPANRTIGQGTSATLQYFITATANGPDDYAITSIATASGLSSITPTLPTPSTIRLGATTVGVAAAAGASSITVPYDGASDGVVNGISAGSGIVVGGNAYVVLSVVENAGANTATLNLLSALTAGVSAGDLVGERKLFDIVVASGTVSSGGTGTQTVATTATAQAGSKPAFTQAPLTVLTVNRPILGVAKQVSANEGASFATSANAVPGTSLIYKIVASNTGASTATKVAFTDVIPPYLTYVAGSARVATSSATAYAAATALTEGAGGYDYLAGSRTVTYAPPAPGDTVAASGGELVLFFRAKID